MAQVGKPYVWGASGPNSFDCSGLTMYAWGAAGVSLPHSAALQYSVTQHVSFSQAMPGDLLFYYSPIAHVAMYLGGGRMIEAPHTGASVQVVSARTTDLVGVGRP
jgi:peptidoglycan DL-endopeptidase CwlO